jgi:tetratricopeptide (TPR) repeat protein
MLALARKLGERDTPLCVVVSASEEADDYSWVVEFLEEVPCNQIVLRSLPAQSLKGKQAFGEWIAGAMVGFLEAGGKVLLDCGLQACALSDQVYGTLTRHGLHLQLCMPRPGVDTSLRLYHCREMVEFAGVKLTSFRKMAQVQDYFYRRHNDLQWDYRFFPECPPCPSLKFARCQGPCMGRKARRMRDEVDRLKAAVAAEGTFESLLALGRGLYELSRFQEAEQCLAEARRLEPSRGDVHLLLGRTLAQLSRLDEADEEYHKAARLLPAGDGVLLEWSHALQERGKSMRSRRVGEEARRLGEELSANGKPTATR